MKDRRLGRSARLAALTLCAGVGIFAGLGLAPSGEEESGGPAEARWADQVADFAYYRQNIEPMFARPRGYPGSGASAACVMCHVWQTSVRFDLDDMTQTPDGWSWTEEQSRRNYEVVTKLVNASDPSRSKLLVKPLAPQAGGEGHTGGTFWESTDDPEYQALLDWIQRLPADRFTPPAAPALDFEFYRACVQQVIATPRPGHLSCTECHSGGSIGFAPAPANGTSWTEAEARRGFAVMERLIVPGDPDQSRWLLKPLHPDGGGSYAHNGVRRWQSRNDPEYRMLAAWIRGERRGSNCSM